MEVPEPLIRWLVLNSSSNRELARFSNVCRRWRTIAVETLAQEATAAKKLDKDKDQRQDMALLLPSMLRYLAAGNKAADEARETYCLSWFHPSGILFKQLPLDGMDDSENGESHTVAMARDHRGDDSPRPFAPSGQQSYAGSEEERKSSRRQQNRSVTSSLISLTKRLRSLEETDRYVNCLYQWNGFSEAFQVLQPFGYEHDFVEAVLKQVKLNLQSSRNSTETKVKEAKEYHNFAVRGSTIARPEGYCLCWDDDAVRLSSAPVSGNSSASNNVREHESNQMLKQWRRRKRELQREVLPKVLNSALTDTTTGGVGLRLPCVQFLNVDSSHAVRLFTPPFKRPARTPITVFCIGIATEDGCFFSGLRRRFEMGHLYPETPQDDLIEQSPICLCTETGDMDWAEENTNTEGNNEEDGQDESFNSDDSSCDLSMKTGNRDPGFKCKCPFTGLGEANEDTDDDDDDSVGATCHGQIGPGMWRCYVAVFDGVDSMIRVDGEKESVHCHIPDSGDVAFLDGLTIGADHTFDMSLCFGQGSDGEGEGAVAELAVFKGRLDLEDIKLLEGQLMQRYGIQTPVLPKSEVVQNDQMTRLAHAMLSHPPRHRLFSSSTQRIPLRVMTKHRVVAWRQTNPVTGERILVQRIGTKFAGSSSDW